MTALRKPIWEDIPLEDNQRRFPMPQGNVPSTVAVSRRFPVIPGFLQQRQGDGGPPQSSDYLAANFYSSSVNLEVSSRPSANTAVACFDAGSVAANRWAIIVGRTTRWAYPLVVNINSVPAKVVYFIKNNATVWEQLGVPFVAYALVPSGTIFNVVASMDANVTSTHVTMHAFRYYSDSAALAGFSRNQAGSNQPFLTSSLFVPANGAGIVETFFGTTTGGVAVPTYVNSIGRTLINTANVSNLQSPGGNGFFSYDYTAIVTNVNTFIDTSANSANPADAALKEQYGVSFGTVTAANTPTIVQMGASGFANSGVTLAANPSSGNLLIGFYSHWNNNPGTNSGWFKLVGSNGAAVDGQTAYVKFIRNGSETANQRPTSISADNRQHVAVFEIGNWRDTVTECMSDTSVMLWASSRCILIDPSSSAGATTFSLYAGEPGTLVVGAVYGTAGANITPNVGTVGSVSVNSGTYSTYYHYLNSGGTNAAFTPVNSGQRMPGLMLTILPKLTF